ncbi:unnamed protein product [Pseudo-nitzschia multistriata]|uniref:Uncharacterized protein n=1 Tax=Pseudo-nitzschia multistriata TaxID=183589 RepID=A0A448ZPA7_9STRA|nr:unnamed protein product [Pseudo-nitzschia multistriata]
MVGHVAKGLHSFRIDIALIDPTGVRCELFEIPDHRLRHVRNATVGVNDVSLGDEDFIFGVANVVPLLRVVDGGIGDHKFLLEVFRFHRSKLRLETLAGRVLAVPIPSHVGSLVAHAEGSLTELVVTDSDVLRGQVGSGGRGIRHASASVSSDAPLEL